jgi:DegV family protein with EDD domain
MAVKVITDSTSDINPELAQELDIGVVPIYVRFDREVYLDGVDITGDEFYRRLAASTVHPTTSQPNPEDFIRVYQDYIGDFNGIVSIHISSKISGTYNSASLAKKTLCNSVPVEVIDSGFNSAGLWLVVVAAARLAQSGASMADVVDEAHRAIKQVRMFGMFETMKYLARSGRVSKTIAEVSRILNVMPLLTFSDGKIIRAGLVRTISKGMDCICDFVKDNLPVSELTIVHSAVPDQAQILKSRLAKLLPESRISIANLGAALGVHGGPGVLVLALRRIETDFPDRECEYGNSSWDNV